MSDRRSDRRQFLKTAGISAAGLGLARNARGGEVDCLGPSPARDTPAPAPLPTLSSVFEGPRSRFFGVKAEERDEPFGDGRSGRRRKLVPRDPKTYYDRAVRMAVPGKSGWFAGVHTALFISRYLGVSYDAPRRVLAFAPSPLLGDRFRWSDFPTGNDHFSVSYEREGSVVKVTASGSSSRATRLEATLPVDGLGDAVTVTVDGKKPLESSRGRHLGRDSVRVVAEIPPGTTVTVMASGR